MNGKGGMQVCWSYFSINVLIGGERMDRHDSHETTVDGWVGAFVALCMVAGLCSLIGIGIVIGWAFF